MITWVDRSLKPVTARPKKDGTMTDRITVADAKKMRLLPTADAVINKVFGTNYQLIDEVCQAAWMIDKKDKDYDTWRGHVLATARERLQDSLETHIQDVVKGWIEHGIKPDNPHGVMAIAALQELLVHCGATELLWRPILGGEGYATSPDVQIEGCDGERVMDFCDCVSECLGSVTLLIDIKMVDLKKFKKPHDSWRYKMGSCVKDRPFCLYVLWLIDKASGESRFMPYWEVTSEDFEWDNVFDLWISMTGYDPREES